MKRKLLLFKVLYVIAFGAWGLTNMLLKNSGIVNWNWFVTTLPITGSIVLLLIGLVIANYQKTRYK